MRFSLKTYTMMLPLFLVMPALAHEGHDHEAEEKKIEKEQGHHHAEKHAEEGEHKDKNAEETHNHKEGEEHEEHGEEEETSSSVGPDKAVTEANPDDGFKLSEKALKALEIQTRAITSQGTVTIPATSLVEFKDEIAVYRLRDGHFKLIKGTAQKEGQTVLFKPRISSDLKSGDHVVTNGVPLLRVAELDAFSEGEAGHAH